MPSLESASEDWLRSNFLNDKDNNDDDDEENDERAKKKN